MKLRKDELPDGWSFHVSIGPLCPHCKTPLRKPEWSVTTPKGTSYPLIGNKSEKQAFEHAIVVAKAHPLA